MTQAITVRRVLMIGAAAAVLVLLALVLVGTAAGTRFLPCASCHQMKPFAESATGAAHASTSCTACHAGDAPGAAIDLGTRVATQMLPAALLGSDGPRAAITQVTREGCLTCHEQVLTQATVVDAIAIDHGACAASGSCTVCHGGTAHPQAVRWPRIYSMEECVLCHQRAGAPDVCDTCHAGRSEKERLAVGSWQVTHGGNWRQTHGMGSVLYCATCHPDTYCVDCHGTQLPHAENWGSQHGIEAKADREGCATCHPGETLCDSCHGMEMPHPAGFLKAHSEQADSVADERCAPCHLVEDCTQCHENHVHPGGPNMPASPSSAVGGDE